MTVYVEYSKARISEICRGKHGGSPPLKFERIGMEANNVMAGFNRTSGQVNPHPELPGNTGRVPNTLDGT